MGAIACLVIGAVADYFLYPIIVQPGGLVINRGQNGLWLRYTWSFGEHKPNELRDLAHRLKANGIRDAYFHVRYVDRSGHLYFRNRLQTKALNQNLRRLSPNIHRIAWIYAGNRDAGGLVDLKSPTIRRTMASEAAWLVREEGFDGVQWDYEICPDQDMGFLQLLEDTRKALPPGASLSTAVPGWYPPPFSRLGWSLDYYRQVARRCDTLAVMAYDSGMVTPHAYVWWVSEQTTQIVGAVSEANSNCHVLMGLPTYGGSTLSHNAFAENLRLALIGVRRGLAATRHRSAWQGIALFADYTTKPSDWQTLEQDWPGSRTLDSQ